MKNKPLQMESNSNTNNRKRSDPLLGKMFFNKYVLKKKLGEGSFGKIYQADFKGELYALKFENKSRGKSLLEAEAYIMSYLKGRNNNN